MLRINAATPPPSISRQPPLNSPSLPSTSPLPPFQPTTDRQPPSQGGVALRPPAKAIAALIPPPAPASVVNHVASSVKNVPIGVAIVGTLLGAVFIVVIIIALLVCSRKRKNDHGPLNSDRPPPPSPQYERSPPQELQQIFSSPLVHGIPMPWNILPPPLELSATEDLYSPKLQGIPVGFSSGNFTIQELALATGIFSKKNLLGEGEFGCVFKGVLPNGRRIAVKRLNKGMNGQGEREFVEEVEIISRVHHKHLVKLVGYCMTSDEKFLVSEFVTNNSLEFHLHGKDQPVMEWATRMKIAKGSAKGLAYLHEDCNPSIIHRGFKASNILLDSRFEAKVADFGLKNLFVDANDDDDDDDIPHKYSRVAGIFGYVAPDNATKERESEKSDVFSYGVMLLELITGRKPLNKPDSSMTDCLVSWAKPLITKAMENQNFDDLVDPRLQSDYNIEEMATTVACAAACLRDLVLHRPRMSQITLSLEGDISVRDLDEGIKSAHDSFRDMNDFETRYNIIRTGRYQ